MNPTSHFLIRRLHSFVLIFPLGYFFLHYFCLVSRILGRDGAESFNGALRSYDQLPLIVVWELLFFVIPFVFHAVTSLVMLYQGEGNAMKLSYASNIRFSLQRALGVVTFLFVPWFLFVTRIRANLSGADLDYLYLVHLFEEPGKATVYLVGMTAVIGYFTQGLWFFAVRWGMVTGERAQKILSCWCLVFFACFSFLNLLVTLRLVYHFEKAPWLWEMLLGFVRNNLSR